MKYSKFKKAINKRIKSAAMLGIFAAMPWHFVHTSLSDNKLNKLHTSAIEKFTENLEAKHDYYLKIKNDLLSKEDTLSKEDSSTFDKILNFIYKLPTKHSHLTDNSDLILQLVKTATNALDLSIERFKESNYSWFIDYIERIHTVFLHIQQGIIYNTNTKDYLIKNAIEEFNNIINDVNETTLLISQAQNKTSVVNKVEPTEEYREEYYCDPSDGKWYLAKHYYDGEYEWHDKEEISIEELLLYLKGMTGNNQIEMPEKTKEILEQLKERQSYIKEHIFDVSYRNKIHDIFTKLQNLLKAQVDSFDSKFEEMKNVYADNVSRLIYLLVKNKDKKISNTVKGCEKAIDKLITSIFTNPGEKNQLIQENYKEYIDPLIKQYDSKQKPQIESNKPTSNRFQINQGHRELLNQNSYDVYPHIPAAENTQKASKQITYPYTTNSLDKTDKIVQKEKLNNRIKGYSEDIFDMYKKVNNVIYGVLEKNPGDKHYITLIHDGCNDVFNNLFSIVVLSSIDNAKKFKILDYAYQILFKNIYNVTRGGKNVSLDDFESLVNAVVTIVSETTCLPNIKQNLTSMYTKLDQFLNYIALRNPSKVEDIGKLCEQFNNTQEYLLDLNLNEKVEYSNTARYAYRQIFQSLCCAQRFKDTSKWYGELQSCVNMLKDSINKCIPHGPGWDKNLLKDTKN